MGWDMERWALGLVGTRELKKKICGRTLYTHPPSPWLLSSLPVCSLRHGCGWLWGGEGQRHAKHQKHALMGVFFVFEGGWGSRNAPNMKSTSIGRAFHVGG